MKNVTMFNHLIKTYNKLAYTHNYIFGFEYKGVVYASYQDSTILASICKLDKASRGAGYSLRFQPTNAQKVALLTESEVVCSKEFFDNMVKDSKYNKGEIFEKLVTENMFGQEWSKDNVPFTKGGDVETDNMAYQVKYQGATFTNEKTLARLSA